MNCKPNQLCVVKKAHPVFAYTLNAIVTTRQLTTSRSGEALWVLDKQIDLPGCPCTPKHGCQTIPDAFLQPLGDDKPGADETHEWAGKPAPVIADNPKTFEPA